MTTGVGGGGGVPGHRSSAHRRFTTLPTRSRRGDWIGRRSRRLSLRETSRPLEWKYVTHGEACRRGPTRHRPPQAAGRAYGSPHGGPRAGSPEWRAARDNRHIGPGSPSARRGASAKNGLVSCVSVSIGEIRPDSLRSRTRVSKELTQPRQLQAASGIGLSRHIRTTKQPAAGRANSLAAWRAGSGWRA